MESFKHTISCVSPRLLITYWLLIMFLSITVSMWAPDLRIEHNVVLSPESQTWSGSLRKVSTFNSVIYSTATVCSSSSAQFRVTLESYATDSVLESTNVEDTAIYKTFRCEKIKLFSVLVTEPRYMLSIETLDIDSFTFTFGYINSEYTEFIIKLKAVLMQLLIVTTAIFALRLQQVKYSRWDSISKYTLLHSVACILYVFPFEFFAVIWNFEVWQVLNNISRVFFIGIVCGYPRYSHNPTINLRLVMYATTIAVFVAGNVLEMINMYASIAALAAILVFLMFTYREQIRRLHIDSTAKKIHTCAELFIMVLLLLGTQCGVFILFPTYSQLESLCMIDLCAYTVYIQFVNSLTNDSICNYYAEALKPFVIESEMIGIHIS